MHLRAMHERRCMSADATTWSLFACVHNVDTACAHAMCRQTAVPALKRILHLCVYRCGAICIDLTWTSISAPAEGFGRGVKQYLDAISNSNLGFLTVATWCSCIGFRVSDLVNPYTVDALSFVTVLGGLTLPRSIKPSAR